MERKEAIEVIRKNWPDASFTQLREALETLITELTESEDERVRKAIERIIRVYGKTQGEWIAGYDMDTLVVHLRDAFAYLEKQKEQKDYRKLYEDIAKSEWFKKAYEGKSLGCDEEQKEQKPFIIRDTSCSKRGTKMPEYCLDVKPEGWSEEDERIYQSIMDDTVQENQLDGKQIDWLMGIKYRDFARPKNTWKPSKEQMNALEYFIRSWGESGTMSPQNPTLCAAESLLNDLKKLM